MNEYNINVDFTKGRISTNLRKLVQNDYNTTKLNFTFDKEGRVLFKMLYPDGTQYVDEIKNNELVFGKGVLSQEGTYEYEISLYSEDGRLTDYAVKSFEVRSELVDTDEIVEPDDRVPVLDTLINEVSTIKQDVEDGKYNGITPTIGENGNWYLDDKDTSMPSRGEKGEQYLYSFTVDDSDAIEYLMGDFSDSFSGYKLSNEVVAQIEEHINYVYQKGEDAFILRGIFKNTKAPLNIPLYEKLFTWDNHAKGGLQDQPIIISLETLSYMAQNSYTVASIRIELTWTDNVAKVSSVKLFGYTSKFLATNYPIEFIPTNDNHPATKKYVDDSIAGIEGSDVDLSKYYTKEETDNAIASIDIPEVDLTDYATTEYVDDAIANNSGGDKLSEHDIYTIELPYNLKGTYPNITDSDSLGKFDEILTNIYRRKIATNSDHYKAFIIMHSQSDTFIFRCSNLGNYPSLYGTYIEEPIDNNGYTCAYKIGITGSLDETTQTYKTKSVKFDKDNKRVLLTNNTLSYNPTSNYHPATKKYVDDAIASAITTSLGGSY